MNICGVFYYKKKKDIYHYYYKIFFQAWFLYSTLIIVVFLNICTAVFQGGIIGRKNQKEQK